MKLKLYIDFDGVILNTIDISYRLIEEKGIELIDSNYDKIQHFFINLDWENLIKLSEPINNSIDFLKQLIESDLYDVTILTHVNSKKEINVKQKYLDEVIPGIDVIYVNKKDNKCDVVACKNTILVDDFTGNLDLWHAKGGIPVKFSTSDKKYQYMTIDNLGTLFAKYDEFRKIVEENV